MKIWLSSLSHFYHSYDNAINTTEKAYDCDDDCSPPGNPDYRDGRYTIHNDDCDGDCDDDCSNHEYIAKPYYHTQSHSSLDQEHLSHIATHRLQLSPTLYMQPCDPSHWLICNPTAAGKIAVIDEDALAFLDLLHSPTTMQEVARTHNSPISSLLHAVLTFIDLGFVDDLDQERVVHNENTGNSTLSAWLHITNACNLRCHYCYISKSSDHMEKDTSRSAVDAIVRSAVRNKYTALHLKYAGGEAALQFPQIIATHDYAQQQAQAHSLHLSASILSNGTIMTQRMIEQLKERRIGIGISLDGIGAAHDQQRPYINGLAGSFSMVNRTISRLLANGLRPSINITVSQRNSTDLPALLSYILERDLHFTLSYYRENDCSSSITDLQFSETQMIDGMRTAFSYIEDHLPKHRIIDSLIDKGNMRAPHHYTCGIGRNYLVINQRGEVAKCQADITRAVTTIHANDPLHDIRNERAGMQAIDVDHKEGCSSCTWRYWCGGGCPLVTFRVTGRNDLRSPNCAIYKALYPDAVRLEALRLLTYITPMTFEISE